MDVNGLDGTALRLCEDVLTDIAKRLGVSPSEEIPTTAARIFDALDRARPLIVDRPAAKGEGALPSPWPFCAHGGTCSCAKFHDNPEGCERRAERGITAPAVPEGWNLLEGWIATKDQMPPDETLVLILHRGEVKIGVLRWKHPGYEDNYEAFRYWDDPINDGQDWAMEDVTHWMPIAALSSAKENSK